MRYLFCLFVVGIFATKNTCYSQNLPAINFITPSYSSVFSEADTVHVFVSFSWGFSQDSIQLILKGNGNQRIISTTFDGFWGYTANITGLKNGVYSLYFYTYLNDLVYSGDRQFTVRPNGSFCCGVHEYGDSIGGGSLFDNDLGYEMDFSNYDINPHTYGYLQYAASGQMSLGSLTNADSVANHKSNISALELITKNDQAFSLFTSSNDLNTLRYGNAGIYGFATTGNDYGGSGLSYEVQDSLGSTSIEQSSTDIDLNANNVKINLADTFFVNASNIIFSSPVQLTDGPEYIFSNGLQQIGNQIMQGGLGGFSANYFTSEDWITVASLDPVGTLQYDDLYGGWTMSTHASYDSVHREAGYYAQGGDNQMFQIYADQYIDDGPFANTLIYGYAGADGPGLSLTVNDSSTHNDDNGIQIYSGGIDLNAPKVQLNFFPNSSDLILSTDGDGNIIQRSFGDFIGSYTGQGFSVGNGLMWTGDEVDLGGDNGFDAVYLPADGSGQTSRGEFLYDNVGNVWYLTAQQNSDSVNQIAGLYFNTDQSGTVGSLAQTFEFYAGQDTYLPTFSNAHADISGYSGVGGPGISLNVYDSASSESNGIQIYDRGIDLNTPVIQLNYFPNNSTNSLILTTDSVGNLVQKPLTSFEADYFPGGDLTVGNGLSFYGSEIELGGDNGFDAIYLPEDGSGQSGYGELVYNNSANAWEMSTQQYTDSLTEQAALTVYTSAYANDQVIELYTGGGFGTSATNTDILAYSGDEGPGISLTVTDSLSGPNNGIQIYDNGLDLNVPNIQLNYLPNTPAMDSVLVTDSLGYIKQKAISSFAAGHWTLAGSVTYDTLDNIGIGTMYPSSKLAVAGTITAQKVKVVANVDWADFVFDSTYALTPLAEVDSFIRVNKHLQGVPSTSDVKKDGLDLANNQAILLKKIEELTLYNIQQNKMILEQAKEMENQKKQLKSLEARLAKLPIN